MYKCVWTFPRLLCDCVEAQELVDMKGKIPQEDDLIGPSYVYKFSCLFLKQIIMDNLFCLFWILRLPKI